eukprot:5015060-Pleurochrysis_carterae.AAC.3
MPKLFENVDTSDARDNRQYLRYLGHLVMPDTWQACVYDSEGNNIRRLINVNHQDRPVQAAEAT